MNKPRRLGRGLEALLGRVAGLGQPSPQPPSAESDAPLTDLPQADAPPTDLPQGDAWSSDVPQGDPSSSLPAVHAQGADMPEPEPSAATADLGTTPQFEAGPPRPEQDAAKEDAPIGPKPPPRNDVSDHSGPVRVDVGRIDSNPFQPRQDFDQAELESLAESLRAHGLLQPLVVRRIEDRYQLVAGERRFRAARQAGWTEVPVQVVEADDRQVAELAIVENLQRRDLNPLEKAASFQRYLLQYGGTQEELAARLKIDRSTIANLIRLLELPEPIQEAVRQGRITQGHARALLPLGDEREQIEFCARIQQEGLSVRRTEALVQETIDEADAEPLRVIGRDGRTARPQRITNEHIAALEQEFRTALGTKVRITHSSRGRGKLVIHFTSHEEFERIRRHVCDPDRPQAHVG